MDRPGRALQARKERPRRRPLSRKLAISTWDPHLRRPSERPARIRGGQSSRSPALPVASSASTTPTFPAATTHSSVTVAATTIAGTTAANSPAVSAAVSTAAPATSAGALDLAAGLGPWRLRRRTLRPAPLHPGLRPSWARPVGFAAAALEQRTNRRPAITLPPSFAASDPADPAFLEAVSITPDDPRGFTLSAFPAEPRIARPQAAAHDLAGALDPAVSIPQDRATGFGVAVSQASPCHFPRWGDAASGVSEDAPQPAFASADVSGADPAAAIPSHRDLASGHQSWGRSAGRSAAPVAELVRRGIARRRRRLVARGGSAHHP